MGSDLDGAVREPWARCRGKVRELYTRFFGLTGQSYPAAVAVVVVSKADSLVGCDVSLDRLAHLLRKHLYQEFLCCFVASVDSFLAVVCRHLPTVASSLLEAQSFRLQASVFAMGPLVPLPTLRHFDGERIGVPGRQRMRMGQPVLLQLVHNSLSLRINRQERKKETRAAPSAPWVVHRKAGSSSGLTFSRLRW